MKTYITTVGTSLLFNARGALKLERDTALAPTQLLDYLRSCDPIRASAESNSLSRLLQPRDHVVFLHSHTDEGRLCAESLCDFYASQEYHSSTCEVTDLHYDQRRFKARGLRALVAALCRLIRQARQAEREVAINATGGFKAEIAYATLVGLILHVPVFYIHEKFQEVIEMPPTPVAWDYALLADYDEFFAWLDADLRPSPEVDDRLHLLPANARMLLQEEDGYTFLSPMGEAFFAAYRELLEARAGERVFLSQQARRALDNATPSRRTEYDATLRKLRVPELRRTNSHAIPPSSDCLAYPSGHNATRVLYFEDNGCAHVCELTSKYDDSYERACARGVFRRDYHDFKPWE